MSSASTALEEQRRALHQKHEHIAEVLTRAGLHAESKRHDVFGLCVIATTTAYGAEYVAQIVRVGVRDEREGIRVRWVPYDGTATSLGTVETPARVAGLILDHHQLR